MPFLNTELQPQTCPQSELDPNSKHEPIISVLLTKHQTLTLALVPGPETSPSATTSPMPHHHPELNLAFTLTSEPGPDSSCNPIIYVLLTE